MSINIYSYHGTIRMYTAMMGTLINDVKIKNDNGIRVVPLKFNSGDKSRIKGESPHAKSSSTNSVKSLLPIMVFGISSIEIDKTRKLNPLNRVVSVITQTEKDSGVVSGQYQPVPVNVYYQVHAKTKHLDELLQIYEQIMVEFDPYIDVLVKDNPIKADSNAIRVELESHTITDDFEGAIEDHREIEASFLFRVEGYLYKRTSDSKIIKEIDIGFFLENNFSEDSLIDTIHIDENTP